MKYQNIGLVFVMLPFLKQLYKEDQEALPSVLNRYLENFNTQPSMASFCFGALAQQETEVAHAKSLTDFKEKVTAWAGIKRGLSITTASIGDRLFWGTLKPLTLLLSLFILLACGINFFEIEELSAPSPWCIFVAALAAFLSFNLISLFVKWQGLSLSFRSDENTCYGLTCFDWNKTIYYAKCTGLVLASGMLLLGVYRYIKDFASFIDVHFFTRATIVLFFVIISFITRKLRLPNMYLYLAAVIVFNIVCYL
jgi:PTS system mannose-specific IID component